MSSDTSLQKIEPMPVMPSVEAMTPGQAKVDAIANLTFKAYERASTLQLTPEEIAGLQADFPDEAFQPGAAGKENLLYIEHAHLRDRLNRVFGPGQWAIIPRNRWAEDFTTAKGSEASRVYVEAMLCIRGCFVAEAVGEMEYWKNNASQNYGDAVEGAKTAALRRCAKELGIGLQAWKKQWCEGWWARKRGGHQASHEPKAPERRGVPRGKPAAHEAPKPATEKTRTWFLAEMRKRFSERDLLQWVMDDGPPYRLTPNETLEDWPLSFVPTSRVALDSEVRRCAEFLGAGTSNPEEGPPEPPGGWHGEKTPKTPKNAPEAAKRAKEGQPEPEHHKSEWHRFPMPWGKHAGTPLGELDKKYLFGLWANYEVETEYQGKPKKPETIEKDQKFREMLDIAGDFYKFDEPQNG